MTLPTFFHDFLPLLLSGSSGALHCHLCNGDERCSQSIQAEILERGKRLMLYQIALSLTDPALKSLVELLYCPQNYESKARQDSVLCHFNIWKEEKQTFLGDNLLFCQKPASNEAWNEHSQPQTPHVLTRVINSEAHQLRESLENVVASASLLTPPSSRASGRKYQQRIDPPPREKSPLSHVSRSITNVYEATNDRREVDEAVVSSSPWERPQPRRTKSKHFSRSRKPRHRGLIQEEVPSWKIKAALETFKPRELETGTVDHAIRSLAVRKVPQNDSPDRRRRSSSESLSAPGSGYLYAMRDFCDKQYAVKVGFTRDLDRRLAELHRECTHAGLTIVSKRRQCSTKFASRAETLAHRLLAGYDVRTACECGEARTGYSHEYFAVSNEQAQQALDIATLFTRTAYREDGTIDRFWDQALRQMAEGDPMENLAGRLARWQSWLDRSERRYTLGLVQFYYCSMLAIVTAPFKAFGYWRLFVVQDIQGSPLGYVEVCLLSVLTCAIAAFGKV